MFAELGNLGALLLHLGSKPFQFSLQILTLPLFLGYFYLTLQLLILAKKNICKKDR